MSGIYMGNVTGLGVASVTLSPASVAANTTAEQTFTVPGVNASDVCVDVAKPTAQAGLGIVGCRVSAANTVGVTFSNNTASPIVPTASQVYQFVIVRTESTASGIAF